MGGGGRQAGRRGAARPWRPPPREPRLSLSGPADCLAGLAERGRGGGGGRPRARCAARPAGLGGARVGAGAAGRYRVNGSARPVPRGAAAATASASRTRAPEGTKPAALDAGDFCSWDLAAGICGCTASGTKLRILPGHFCLGTVNQCVFSVFR